MYFAFCRITVAVKKEGWGSRIPGSLGGGLTRTLSFRMGNSGDLPILKPINKQQLGIAIGVGLPRDSSKLSNQYVLCTRSQYLREDINTSGLHRIGEV